MSRSGVSGAERCAMSASGSPSKSRMYQEPSGDLRVWPKWRSPWICWVSIGVTNPPVLSASTRVSRFLRSACGRLTSSRATLLRLSSTLSAKSAGSRAVPEPRALRKPPCICAVSIPRAVASRLGSSPLVAKSTNRSNPSVAPVIICDTTAEQ